MCTQDLIIRASVTLLNMHSSVRGFYSQFIHVYTLEKKMEKYAKYPKNAPKINAFYLELVLTRNTIPVLGFSERKIKTCGMVFHP